VNGPWYLCGVVNTLEVVGDIVPEANLYDVGAKQSATPLLLSAVERQLQRAPEGKGGV